MRPPGSDTPDLEFAYVLFMDIVEFSTRPPDEQRRLIQELQQVVRAQAEYRRAVATDDLMCLPTGDGMALVFFREPVAPLQCAVQIARALRSCPHLPLRLGVHCGPVYRVEDINANANVTGGGINTAQRVMDCGEAGHLLVSSAVKELVGQVGLWPMEDLGECEVKHGRLHLFNVYGGDFGSASRPARLRRPRGESTLSGRKIVLLYRRQAQPDAEVLALVADYLASLGCDVFWDRHIKVGMKWAEEIARRIREADAVIPLISAASMRSEMLEDELFIARDAAESRGGLPRLLPVRIRYTGDLPGGIAGMLNPIEYALWEGPKDDARLLEELADGLETPPEEARPAARLPTPAPEAPAAEPALSAAGAQPAPLALEAVGGAVPLGSRFYLERDTDAEFLQAIQRRDSIVLVNGARQMGKTSLLARGLQRGRETGCRVAMVDCQWLSADQLETADSLFRTLGEALADQLELDQYPDEVWNVRSGPSVNFQRYMRRAVLSGGSPVVWGLDEVDRLFVHPYASEVFGLFRSWHNARALDPAGPWSQLTLAIAYATEAHLFITDVNQSPFNVGTRVTLSDFSHEQVGELNRRYGSPLAAEADVQRFFRLLNGHPYLTRRGLHELATRRLSMAEFADLATANEGPYGDHLRRILMLLARDASLTDVVRGILRGEPCPTTESFYRLRSAGLVVGDSSRTARPRCQLYAAYLERHLL